MWRAAFVVALCTLASVASATYYPSKFVLTGGSANASLSTSATHYFPMGMERTSTTGQFEHWARFPRLFPHRMYCQASGSPGAGKSYTITIQRYGVVTDWSCAIAEGNSTCEDTSGAAIAVGLNEYASVPAGTPTARNIDCILEGRL